MSPMTANPTPLPPEGVTQEEIIARLTRKARLGPSMGSADSSGRSVIYDDGMRYVNPDGPSVADWLRARIAVTSAAEGEVGELRRDLAGSIEDAKLLREYVALYEARATEAEAANARLKEFISDQATLAEMRIKNGMDLGATVWRIALEDFTRESRAILDRLDQGAEE